MSQKLVKKVAGKIVEIKEASNIKLRRELNMKIQDHLELEKEVAITLERLKKFKLASSKTVSALRETLKDIRTLINKSRSDLELIRK